jgi:hypothetical protein
MGFLFFAKYLFGLDCEGIGGLEKNPRITSPKNDPPSKPKMLAFRRKESRSNSRESGPREKTSTEST